MYLAFASTIGFTVASFVAFRWGLGLHDYPVSWVSRSVKVSTSMEVDTERSANVYKAGYVLQIFDRLSIFLIKMSLLFLYLRLGNFCGFGISLPHSQLIFLPASGLRNWFYKGTIMMMTVLVAQYISTIVATGLQCVPIMKYWKPNLPGHCVSITALFYCERCSPPLFNPRLSADTQSSIQHLYDRY